MPKDVNCCFLYRQLACMHASGPFYGASAWQPGPSRFEYPPRNNRPYDLPALFKQADRLSVRSRTATDPPVACHRPAKYQLQKHIALHLSRQHTRTIVNQLRTLRHLPYPLLPTATYNRRRPSRLAHFAAEDATHRASFAFLSAYDATLGIPAGFRGIPVPCCCFELLRTFNQGGRCLCKPLGRPHPCKGWWH